MPDFAHLDLDAYIKDAKEFDGDLNNAGLNQKYGMKVVVAFRAGHADAIQAEKDRRKKPKKEFRKAKGEGAERNGDTGRKPGSMTPEAKAEMREKQFQTWGITKIWRMVLDGSLSMAEAEAMAAAGNVSAQIALPTLRRCMGTESNVQELKLLIERVEGLQKQQIEQTITQATDLSGVPTEILEQLLPYLPTS